MDGGQLARVGIGTLTEAGGPAAEAQPLEVEHHRHFAREAEGHREPPGDRVARHRDLPRAVARPQPAADVREFVADRLETIDRQVGAAEPLLDRPPARPVPPEVEQPREARGLDAALEPEARVFGSASAGAPPKTTRPRSTGAVPVPLRHFRNACTSRPSEPRMRGPPRPSKLADTASGRAASAALPNGAGSAEASPRKSLESPHGAACGCPGSALRSTSSEPRHWVAPVSPAFDGMRAIGASAAPCRLPVAFTRVRSCRSPSTSSRRMPGSGRRARAR